AYVISVIVALALIAFSYLCYKTVTGMGVFPQKYMDYFMYALIGVNVFFGLIAFIPGVNTLNKCLQIVICGTLSVALAIVNFKIPDYLGQFERMFKAVPQEGTLLMSVYALSDSETIQSVTDLKDAKIAVLAGKDEEFLDYSKRVISRELLGAEIETTPYEDIYTMAEDLYNGTVDAVLMNETYARFIAENSDFEGFNYKTRIIYTVAHKIQLNYETNDVGNITQEPFIVVISGSDSWDYSGMDVEKNDIARSDVNMVLVIHPVTKQILIISIPRDTYVPLWGDTSAMDKLTHATIYGMDTWEKAINSLLGIKINYFVRVNFQSLVNVVDTLGGIDIDNPYEMTISFNTYDKKTGRLGGETFTFKQGIIHITGNQALGYVRERKSLREGDVDRVRHQAVVIQGIVNKVTQVSVITKIGDLLKAVEGTFISDINVNKIYALVQMQIDDMASWHISSATITGSVASKTSYAMGSGTTTKTVKEKVARVDENGESVLDDNGNQIYDEVEKTVTVEPSLYSVFIPDTNPINAAKALITKVLNGEVLPQ
ncbi:MAG: LCP family protein, partial [Erysipelotrichaceae bacterium]|nr:LCP family protein [Erysipelotrichaceae bacterium]